MKHSVAAILAILVGGGILWAAAGLVPPSNEAQRDAYRQADARGSLFWDAESYVAWSVPATLGHEWTCRVHLDIVADPGFLEHGAYGCSPWPWAGWFRKGRY
jgi:hypothetical protein